MGSWQIHTRDTCYVRLLGPADRHEVVGRNHEMLLLKVTIIEQISTTTNTKPAPRSNRNGHEPKRGNRGRGAERPRLLPGRDARGPAAPLGVARGPVDCGPPASTLLNCGAGGGRTPRPGLAPGGGVRSRALDRSFRRTPRGGEELSVRRGHKASVRRGNRQHAARGRRCAPPTPRAPPRRELPHAPPAPRRPRGRRRIQRSGRHRGGSVWPEQPGRSVVVSRMRTM